MPLQRAKTKKARQANVKELIATGRPPKQAVAISYAVQRRSGRKR